MSLGDLLPVQFYELAFLFSFVFMPVLAWRADFENYIFGALVMFMCLRIVRRRKRVLLPADDKAVFISGCDSGRNIFRFMNKIEIIRTPFLDTFLFADFTQDFFMCVAYFGLDQYSY